jgi:hypothetical protein
MSSAAPNLKSATKIKLTIAKPIMEIKPIIEITCRL